MKTIPLKKIELLHIQSVNQKIFDNVLVEGMAQFQIGNPASEAFFDFDFDVR